MTRRHGKEVSSPQPRPCENVEIHLKIRIRQLDANVSILLFYFSTK